MDTNTPATQAFSQSSPIQEQPSEETRHLGPGIPPGGGGSTPSGDDGSITPARPKGLNAPAVVLGVVALALGGGIIANETLDLSIDWSGKGPAVIVGIGLLFVVLGAIGLVRRRNDT